MTPELQHSLAQLKEVFDEILKVGKVILRFGGNFFIDLVVTFGVLFLVLILVYILVL